MEGDCESAKHEAVGLRVCVEINNIWVKIDKNDLGKKLVCFCKNRGYNEREKLYDYFVGKNLIESKKA